MIIGVVSIIFAGAVATKSFADTKDSFPLSDFGPPQKITPEEKQKIIESTKAIYYKGFGEFRRVSSAQSLDVSEIAYTEDSINSQTKELILDDGIFVKVSDN